MKKKKTQILGIILIILTALVTSLGQFAWKYSSNCSGSAKILLTVAGFAVFGVSGFLMIVSYRFGELSIIQPLLSIGFVFSLVLGKIFLHEEHSIFKYIGIAVILAGVFILARAGTKSAEEEVVEEIVEEIAEKVQFAEHKTADDGDE